MKNIWETIGLPILAAITSFAMSMLFKGGPGTLYDNGKFKWRIFIWLFAAQFLGSISIFILTSHLFTDGGIFAQNVSLKNLVPFLMALLPIEISFIYLIILIHRIWLMVIKKVDPNFDERDPLGKIPQILNTIKTDIKSYDSIEPKKEKVEDSKCKCEDEDKASDTTKKDDEEDVPRP